MVQIMIDVSVYGSRWFQRALFDIEKDESVHFLYSDDWKYQQELRKTPKLLAFLKSMAQDSRLIITDKNATEARIEFLQSKKEWQREEACDDPHIFAMIYEKPTRFVFTGDGRLRKCRTCMRKVVKKRYSKFILISNEGNYEKYRSEIHPYRVA